MSAIDWESKPEPWRSVGLDWVAEIQRTAAWTQAPPIAPKPPPAPDSIVARRHALGLAGHQLDAAAGVFRGAASQAEHRPFMGGGIYQKIIAALDRLEAERADIQAAAERIRAKRAHNSY